MRQRAKELADKRETERLKIVQEKNEQKWRQECVGKLVLFLTRSDMFRVATCSIAAYAGPSVCCKKTPNRDQGKVVLEGFLPIIFRPC